MKNKTPRYINAEHVPGVDFCEQCGFIVARNHTCCEDPLSIEVSCEIDFNYPEDYV